MTVRLPFHDRAEAGALLGDALAARLDATARSVALGIPRGGVVVALEVARVLGAPLDILVAHKIGAPENPEFALGAVTADGTTLLESWARRSTGLSEEALSALASIEIENARERERRLRGDRPRLDLRGWTAILVDDGIATGATVHAAAIAARALGADRVVIAAPVASIDAVELLAPASDDLVILATPERFWAVGQWYERFGQVEDEEVRRILASGDRATAAGDAP